jgi:anaerobic selenocysteine-containing dehydrogenase
VSNTLNSFSSIVLPGNIGWDNLINEIITKSKNEIVKKRILAIKYYNKKQKSMFARNLLNDEESTNYSFLKAKRTFQDAFTNNTNTNKTIINENKTNTNPDTANEIVNNAQVDVDLEGTEFNLKE